jgi:predicted ATPase
MALGTPLMAVHGWLARDFEVRAERAAFLAEKLGEVQLLYSSLAVQWTQSIASGNYRRARKIAEQARTLAMRHQDDRVLGLGAHYAMGVSLLYSGELAACREEFQQVLTLYDPERDASIPTPVNLFTAGSAHLALALWISGYPEHSSRMQKQAFNYAAEIKRPLTTGYVHSEAGAHLEQLCGNVDAVLAHTKVLTALMGDHDMTTWQGLANVFEGWATSWSGSAEHGISLMQQGLTYREHNNNTANHPYFMSLLAQIHARNGNVKEALLLCSDAHERAQRTEEIVWLAEMHRIEGEAKCAVSGSSVAEVEDCFRKALDASRRQGARMFELRAAISLARLWRDQGKGVEARNLLAPICDWFSEGFDTVDLKAAKALLAELSA